MTTTQSAHRIVVGVDGSACSVSALNWAARYAEMAGGVRRGDHHVGVAQHLRGGHGRARRV